jgi:hypothetical protein
MFDEHQHEILSRGRACLRSCEEKGQALIYDHSVVSLKIVVSKQNAK